MLSPNDMAPKNKAPSIWSFDSGYGSNTLDDDDVRFVTGVQRLHDKAAADSPQTNVPVSPTATPSSSQSTQLPISLGLGKFWNVRVEDKLRLRRPDATIEPVTTRLNVFTTRDGSSTDFLLPSTGNAQETCATCRVWNVTWPEKGLVCDECRNENVGTLETLRTFDGQSKAEITVPQLEIPEPLRLEKVFRSKSSITPETLHTFGGQPKAKLTVPQLEIPKSPRWEKIFKSKTSSRCSACEIALLIDPTKSATCCSCTPETALLSPVSAEQTTTIRRSCAKRPTRLPPHALQGLQAWLQENRNNPYPNTNTKRALAKTYGISEKQVNTWFTNARARGMLKDVDRSNLVDEDERAFDGGSTSGRRRSTTSDHTSAGLEHSLLTKSRRGKKKDYSQLESISPVTGHTSSIPPTPVVAPSPSEGVEQDKWQCTFCYHHVAPKAWRRHEETQHRPKRKWTCLRDGPCITIPSRSGTQTMCAFCMIKDPSEEHLQQSHRIGDCMLKSDKERTFLRSDHLRQHVQNFHKAPLHDSVRDQWRINAPSKHNPETWPCGFCGLNLTTWETRETHIASHFKDGLTMAHWTAPHDPDTPATPSRKRCNESPEPSSSVFSKLARTLSGHAWRQQQQQQQENSAVHTAPATATATATATPSMAPLWSDMLFDTSMPDFHGDILSPLDPASSRPCYPSSSQRCDSAFPQDGEGDGQPEFGLNLDLDLGLSHDLDMGVNMNTDTDMHTNMDLDLPFDFDALLHDEASEFRALWDRMG